jgi:nucleoside-diphosphate-sugar epimerase
MDNPLFQKRIMLVGGAGFIGHNLALELARLGADVSIIDSLFVNSFLSLRTAQNGSSNKALYLKILDQRMDMLEASRVPLYVQDARDYHMLSPLVSKIKPQVVVHLAAVAHANISNKDPYSTFDHSFRTLENMLDCSRNNVEHFIFFSSSMVYGNFENGTVTEETPCNPLGIYGSLKLGGELLVKGYQQVFGLPYTIIRPSALYGERCISRRVGQIFIENAIQGRGVSINGDGADRLDFTYIDDLVQGVVKVIENKNSRNQIFNLTYGGSCSLNDMADIIQRQFPGVPVTYLPKDDLMPDRGTLSVDKARRLIGYEPQWPLSRGFVKYIEWYKSIFKGPAGHLPGELECGRQIHTSNPTRGSESSFSAMPSMCGSRPAKARRKASSAISSPI